MVNFSNATIKIILPSEPTTINKPFELVSGTGLVISAAYSKIIGPAENKPNPKRNP